MLPTDVLKLSLIKNKQNKGIPSIITIDSFSSKYGYFVASYFHLLQISKRVLGGEKTGYLTSNKLTRICYSNIA